MNVPKIVETIKFLREFILHPIIVSSVIPSSATLSRTLVSMAPQSDNIKCILELGCGTGAVTTEILKTYRKATIISMDINPAFTEIIQKKFPEIIAINDSAENMEAHIRRYSTNGVNVIFSSLPWAAFSSTIQENILNAIHRTLCPGGEFLTYSYLHTRIAFPSHKKFIDILEQRFKTVTYSPIIWKNIPPAIVIRCKK